MAGRGPKSYPDLRYLFMRGLIQHEKCQRSRHYLKPAAECTSRAIVSLELSDEPVKTVKQARKLEGIGGETCIKLTKLDEERNYSFIRPLGGRFVSSAGGILVALLNCTEEILLTGHSEEKPVLIPEDKVKNEAHHLTEETFHSGQSEAFCPAWWRLEVLIKRGFIKRRSVKKSPVLQLLPLGKQVAQRLRERNGLLPPSAPKSVPSFPSFDIDRSFKDEETEEIGDPADPVNKTTSQGQEKSIYTNDTGADGLVLLVDTQEMGGERVGLGEVCQLLDQRGVVYRTRKLKTGDYSWLWRYQGSDIILPCLVERKRADDLARTLKEGRFWSQIKKMVEWKGQFDVQDDCKLYYILERRPEEYVVRCTDGCQGIGKCGDPTLQQLKLVIADLKRRPELLVRETASLEMTTVVLASLTSELKDRIKEGKFDWLLQKLLTENSTDSQTQQTPNHHYDDQQGTNNPTKQSTVIGAHTNHSHKVGSADWYEKIKPENLTYEEQLELALEMSKKDVTVRPGDCDSGCDSQLHCPSHQTPALYGYESRKVSGSQRTEKESQLEEPCFSNVDVDTYKEDYGLAKQKSKLAVVGERNSQCARNVCSSGVKFTDADEAEDVLSHPLMQYHCSPGASVIYPHKAGYRKNIEQSGYRPKMNRERTIGDKASTISYSTAQSGLRSDHYDRYNSGVDRSPTHTSCPIKATKKLMTDCVSVTDCKLPSPFHADVSQGYHTQNKTMTVTKPSGEGIAITPSDTASKDTLYKDVQDKENLSTKCEKSPRKRAKSQITKCKTDLSTFHETDSSIVDLDSFPAKTVKSKPKKIKLHFTPSPLNTETNIARTFSSDIKRSVKKRPKKADSDLNSLKNDDPLEVKPGTKIDSDVSFMNTVSGLTSLEVKPETEFMNDTSLFYDNDKQSSYDKSDSVLVKSENDIANRCDVGGKTETEDDCDSYRSDEDLFPEAECSVNKVAFADQPFSYMSSDNDVDENRTKYLSKTSLNTSFSSSCSNQSLPELDIIMAKTGHGFAQFFDKESQSIKTTETSIDKDSQCMKTTETLKQSKTDEKVMTVMSVLPHVSEAAARSTLKTCGGDVEMCVSVLLES